MRQRAMAIFTSLRARAAGTTFTSPYAMHCHSAAALSIKRMVPRDMSYQYPSLKDILFLKYCGILIAQGIHLVM
jgi:hypothetical protein